MKIAKELAQAIPSPVSVVGEKVRREEEGRRSEETWMVREEPPASKQPPQPRKREVREKDKELVQKVKELQKRKAELQKRRHSSKVGRKHESPVTLSYLASGGYKHVYMCTCDH